jgi:cytoskeletal protein RodZ
VSTPSAPRNLGVHRGKHSKSRGDPWRLPIVIPALLILACVVGVVIYALTGGFTTHSANGATGGSHSTTTLATLPTLPPSSTTTTSSIVPRSTTTSAAPATSTTASSTTTTVSTTTTTVAPVTTIPASQVLVEVENGSGQPGQAKQVATALTSAGFEVNGTGDATSYNYKESDILYSDGSGTAATTLAAAVEGAVTTTETPGIPTGEVYFIVGADYEGVRS